MKYSRPVKFLNPPQFIHGMEAMDRCCVHSTRTIAHQRVNSSSTNTHTHTCKDACLACQLRTVPALNAQRTTASLTTQLKVHRQCVAPFQGRATCDDRSHILLQGDSPSHRCWLWRSITIAASMAFTPHPPDITPLSCRGRRLQPASGALLTDTLLFTQMHSQQTTGKRASTAASLLALWMLFAPSESGLEEPCCATV